MLAKPVLHISMNVSKSVVFYSKNVFFLHGFLLLFVFLNNYKNIQNLCIDVNVSVYILVYICPILVESTLYIGLNVGFSYFRLREYGSNFVLVKLCALDKCAGIVKK